MAERPPDIDDLSTAGPQAAVAGGSGEDRRVDRGECPIARGDRAAQRAEGPASSEAKWDGKVDDVPIQNPRIDGKILSFSIIVDGDSVNVEIKMIGNQLFFATPSIRNPAVGVIPGERSVLNKLP